MELPQTIARALKIDADREDTKWADSRDFEVDSLIDIECFEFKPAGTMPPDNEYQDTTLHCIFAVKHDLSEKGQASGGRTSNRCTDRSTDILLPGQTHQH